MVGFTRDWGAFCYGVDECAWVGGNFKMKAFIDQLESQKLMKLNLQLFTEGSDGGSGGDPGAGEPGSRGGEGEPKPITFASQSEFDSAVDKHVTKALNTAKASWEKSAQERIDAAKTEAEKLANMTAEQQAEAKRLKEAEELAAREADITRRELRAQAIEQLAEKELPKELVDVVVLTDADACNKSIEAVEKAFREAVEAGVNKRLAQSASTPPSGSGGSGGNNEVGSFGSRIAKNNLAKQTESKFFKN